jgi:hypothetical protein
MAMSGVSLAEMRGFLSKSFSSKFNANKLNGLLAEIGLRKQIEEWGFTGRVSPGGWIARTVGTAGFGNQTVVLFPDTVLPGTDYPPSATNPTPSWGLHTICATFHQIGIRGYWCTPCLPDGTLGSLTWKVVQLGVPIQQRFQEFEAAFDEFSKRKRRHNFLANKADVSGIPDASVPEEFSKEHLRITFASKWMSEMVDVDGFIWGQEHTYPIEIKEKTSAKDNNLGEFFGLDIGPFVKLSFYAAKRGNLHSLFIVREIDDTKTRNLVAWWAIRFEELAKFASWNAMGGGKNMKGGRSMVVKIPKTCFERMDQDYLERL